MSVPDNPSVPIVAYKERPSADPMSGERGILRDEWRLVPATADCGYTYDRLRALLPYSSSGLAARVVLEHRYIRRGVEEPWEPFEAYAADVAALGDIDPCATAVDARLVTIQVQRRAEREREDRETEDKRRKDAEAAECARVKQAGQDAFRRLLEGKDGDVARRWNAFTQSADAELRERLRVDDVFMALYNAAMTSHTVPTKRRTIKECLAYVEKLVSKKAEEVTAEEMAAGVVDRMVRNSESETGQSAAILDGRTMTNTAILDEPAPTNLGFRRLSGEEGISMSSATRRGKIVQVVIARCGHPVSVTWDSRFPPDETERTEAAAHWGEHDCGACVTKAKKSA